MAMAVMVVDRTVLAAFCTSQWRHLVAVVLSLVVALLVAVAMGLLEAMAAWVVGTARMLKLLARVLMLLARWSWWL
eukprot:1078375-Pleurochrysis_carterae.AAC.3